MKQPEAYIDFEVYEDSSNLLGVANITPPDITFLTQTISGAGVGGNVEAVLAGVVDAMQLQMSFRSVTDAVVNLTRPIKHQLDLRVAEQQWDTVSAAKEVVADKYIMLVVPKTTTVGQIAPAAASAASGTYTVYRYEAWRNGKELWCIDPMNHICRIGGYDYMQYVNSVLGR